LALIDVVKHVAPDDTELVWKFPSDNLKLGSQLVVGEGQAAVFVKGGQALDIFLPGTYTLSTGNIPLLHTLVNLPFGGNSPFSSEVWFVATTAKRDLRWGTPSSIPIMDATLGFPISARSFGKWGARIRDPRAFVTQLVGAQIGADSGRVREYFIGKIIQSLATHIGSMISRGETSILQIAVMLNEISSSASTQIAKELDKFGIELINFDIESINIPDDEMTRIQDVFAKTMEARELSRVEVSDSYRTLKSFEIMETAASNESGNAIGSLLGAGIGLGAGLPIGTQIAKEVTIDSDSAEGQEVVKLKKLKQLFDSGLITEHEYSEKKQKILDEL